jgi:hypothetical protein
VENIKRWIPFDVSDAELRNQLRNKMIRPTTIPQRLQDLQIEQAVAREALRLAFDHHKSLARGLEGGAGEAGGISGAFDAQRTGKTLVNMMALDMIVGSGGVLSHAPRRAQSALMMMDAYQPEGVTLLTVDSIFMMPQLGILSTIHPEAATQVFEADCLVYLGTCISPVGQGKEGEPCVTVTMGGQATTVNVGQIKVLPLGFNEQTGVTDGGSTATMGHDALPSNDPKQAEITIEPGKNFDVGEGKGRPRTVTATGGVVGLIIDARGRPLQLPADDPTRIRKLKEWLAAMGIPTGE